MLLDSATGTHSVLTKEEKTAIQEQMERLVASSYFSHSRRFPSFLRFVVEQTLAGHEDVLKERTIGIEIFGRPADYDTSTDPIVRVTAAEIRKRIAQYYQDAGHEHDLRISLPAGSYVPQFQLPHSSPITDAGSAEHTSLLENPSSELSATAEVKGWNSWKLFVSVALILILALGASLWMWRSARRTPFEFFWEPMLTSGDPILICVADQKQYSTIALRDANDQSRQTILPDNLIAVVYDDLSPTVKIAGILQANGKKYSLRSESTTNLTDLRGGPTVFVGAFDNTWTLRLVKPLRYHFANDPAMTRLGIVDANAPTAMRWFVDRTQQMATNNYRDYAIVARFTDPTTGKLAVISAGVGRGGTIASGEFLTDSSNLAELMRAAKAAGDKKNMEAVISTQIIGGEPGSPKMEAVYFW
ncbi:hypothetical protein HNQ77_000848 [Silvibacterium bohemicum]|uniref:Adenylate cyclase n=1 Tax=Silvibacterium bohemicum TaxID=1577686 RepID=A0A841JY52_9BACT|nr:hypothetical protein [Silvibacterium bohemicum]MBB6142904.1 hypothetical protein [Silvibacterium bohemicum]